MGATDVAAAQAPSQDHNDEQGGRDHLAARRRLAAADLASDVLTSEGRVVHLRAIQPDDAEALVAFHEGLSFDTVYRRFFSAHPHLSPHEVEVFTRVDYQDRLALVVEDGGRLVAVGRYERVTGTDDAEVAFVVADDHQGRGLGTLLLEHLAAAARARGIVRFVAVTLPTNTAMQRVFNQAGFAVERRSEPGAVAFSFPIAPTEAFEAAVAQRDRVAERRSLEALLRPASIAVVGASARPGGVGHGLVANIVSGGFAGPVYPVNRQGDAVCGRAGYAQLGDIPGPVDLVVAAVGPEDTVALVADAARLGAHGLVVVSAGFAETGAQGAEWQRRLVDQARRHGIRVVGPNCLGVANTDPAVALNATFSATPPTPGRTALFSQSGAVGIVALEQAARIGLGISTFVSGGNKADVSGNDLLELWTDDPSTDVVCLYLESLGNPRRFARLARRLSASKPVVALKSGRSDAGQRAAGSHTAAAASPDVAVDALFARAGVIRVTTMTELFDTALLVGDQPLPAGPAVAVVGNAGGPGILAADACSLAGLDVPVLAPATQTALRSLLPAAAAVANPVDLLAGATGAQYRAAVSAALADPGVDAVIVVYTSPLGSDPSEVGAGVAAATIGATKPVIACFLDSATPPAALRHPAGSASAVPCLPFPERAAAALSRAWSYRRWRDRPHGDEPSLAGVDAQAGRRVVAGVLAARPGGGWLDAADAWALLRAYGLPLVESRPVTSAAQAMAEASEVGFPVALKAASGRLVHKSDVGAIHLGLADQAAVGSAWSALEAALGNGLGTAVVQPMAAPGVETIVGVVDDPAFGPLVMFGLGGVATDLLGDRALRSTPLTDVDAADMVRSLRASPLLAGYRGAPSVDLGALADVLQRVGRLADDLPEVAELDLNPIIARPDGALILDAKIRVVDTPRRSDPWLRRLP